MQPRQIEDHSAGRSGWLRAAVLGANDGLLSTASLVLGVAAAHGTRHAILIAGGAGLVSGALSMASGEYVSVHSQRDSEQADLLRERSELKDDPSGELAELAGIYESRGLDKALARQVAEQLTLRDALAAHARDELGLTEAMRARPFEAALASAASFAAGAALPLVVSSMAPTGIVLVVTGGCSLAGLAMLGGLAAYAGGARIVPGGLRVTFWGMLAMSITTALGSLVGNVR